MTVRERAGDSCPAPAAPLLLHVLPGFGPGGAQSRIVVLVNRLGRAFRHVIVSLNNDLGAADRIDPSVDARCLGFRAGANPVTAVKQLAGLLRQWRPALLLTYNWGSIEAVAAARLSHACPVIHTEDGFGDEEAARQKARRVFTRRLVLRGVNRVIAPSLRLEAIMRNLWRLPSRVVKYLPNGVDTGFYLPASPAPRPNPELVVGAAGQLRPEKRQEDLIKLCAELQREIPVKLRIAGDGPERERLENCARETGLGGRVEFLGQVRDLRSFYAGLDLFLLTSSTE